MQSINYWQQFESTGKIADYLNYKSHSTQPGEQAVFGEREGEAESNPYAGIRMCDRNGIEAGTYRGI